MAYRLFVSAGEPSGDKHLARVLEELQTRISVRARGLCGPESVGLGAESIADFQRLSVLGFSEVIRSLPFFLSLEKISHRILDAWKPHALLLVDYPGFNQRLGRAAKKRGIPVLYYIAPQVWAWKKDRRPSISRCVDHLLAVFPFEEPLFAEAGIPTTFVGHPLLDETVPWPPETRPENPLRLAIVPGSRAQEVERLLPVLLEGTDALAERGVSRVVSWRTDLPEALYEPARRRHVSLDSKPLRSLALGSTAALVASGTATLEVGLTETPMGVVYKTGRLNWMLAQRLIGINTVALANIAVGGNRVPELLQHDCTPQAVGSLAQRILFDPQERQEQREYLSRLGTRLGKPGAAKRVADIVARTLEPHEASHA